MQAGPQLAHVVRGDPIDEAAQNMRGDMVLPLIVRVRVRVRVRVSANPNPNPNPNPNDEREYHVPAHILGSLVDGITTDHVRKLWPGLQPYVTQPATLRGPACNPNIRTTCGSCGILFASAKRNSCWSSLRDGRSRDSVEVAPPHAIT